jgi:adenosylmethionine-8-amino-7-oxononanoate aminotransferase
MQSATHIFHRQLDHEYPLAVSGSGVYLRDATGKEYIDASGGAAVSCLGHGHPEVIAAIHAQIDKLAYAHTAFFTTEVAEELAHQLIRTSPSAADFSHVYFVSGGSEAVETALKMARQYFVEVGQPERKRFIARRQSYHGNTLGALAVGGNKWRRAQFEPLLIDVTHVAPCYAYRDKQLHESDLQYGLRLARELEEAILTEPPDSVIAFVAETIGGATSGVITPVQGYLAEVRKVCDRYGVLLILDEVMCGMGRTGTLHAWEQEGGAAPDIQTIAKGLGGGYQPIGAVLANRRIIEAMRQGSGFFHHGHTYLGHATACAAALAVQKVIERDNLMEQVRLRGAFLQHKLLDRFGDHEFVGDVRGRGLFAGVEIVKDRGAKAPFDPKLALNSRIKKEAMARGLACYPAGGTVDGKSGDHVMLAPPFIATEAELSTIVERLGDSIDAAIASCS